jgi:hypothetical protein
LMQAILPMRRGVSIVTHMPDVCDAIFIGVRRKLPSRLGSQHTTIVV